MIPFLVVIHVIVSMFLILVVLLQQGKGQDIGSAFGGGGSQASVGARSGTSLLGKLTTVAAAMFMMTSLSLTILISQPRGGSVLDDDALSVPIVPQDTLPIDGLLPADTLDLEDVLPAGGDEGLDGVPEDEPGN